MLLNVPYGTQNRTLDLVGKEVDLAFMPSFPTAYNGGELEMSVWEALEKPVAGPPFSSLVYQGCKVALLVDNFARATPARLILPPILRFLRKREAETVILIANGALWEMTEQQLESKLGREILDSGIRIVQNRARQPGDYQFVGVSSMGTPLWVHKEFVEADVRVGIGLTQVNLWGYGGGGKILLPGVCSYETIEWNHHLSTAPGSTFGYSPHENPIRLDIEESAEITGLQMVLNVILNASQEIIDIKAGRPRQVHLASVNQYNHIYSYRVENPADIAIGGSFPWDVLFAHACWGAVGLDRVTREGGTIILAVPCPSGIGHVTKMKKYMPPNPTSLAEALKDFYYRQVEFWDGVIWYKLLEVLTRKELIVITEEKNLTDFKDLGIRASTSLQETYESALKKRGPGARVAYIPYAKWCVPYL